jgi:hypothetical protein
VRVKLTLSASLAACTLFILFLITEPPAQGEEWLSNRFAQNCSGCHAPGRFNKPLVDRRCTLSCQGCHVNPNGGGMRSLYGVWTQNRWLKSAYLKPFSNAKIPAPFSKQNYKDNYASKKTSPKRKHKKRKRKKVQSKGNLVRPVLRETNTLTVNESSYDRWSDLSWKNEVDSEKKYLSRIPEEDPYIQKRRQWVNAGGDARYLYTKPSGGSSRGWLMNVDFGVHLKPVPRFFNIVAEAKFLNQPTNASPEEVFTTEARPKTAYIMFDDLPMNSYVMYGLYRPMFGHFDPNHTSLGSSASGLGARALYRAVGVGTAPNVPFLNANFIFPTSSTAFDQSRGYVVNLGGRFVTLGGSVMLSLWNTKSPDLLGDNVEKKMISISSGMTIARIILNIEVLRIENEFAKNAFDKGNVYTAELKYRLWREIYPQVNFAIGNTAPTLKAGKSTEFGAGFKSFLLAGTELEGLYVSRRVETPAIKTTASDIRFQFHVFF